MRLSGQDNRRKMRAIASPRNHEATAAVQKRQSRAFGSAGKQKGFNALGFGPRKLRKADFFRAQFNRQLPEQIAGFANSADLF